MKTLKFDAVLREMSYHSYDPQGNRGITSLSLTSADGRFEVDFGSSPTRIFRDPIIFEVTIKEKKKRKKK